MIDTNNLKRTPLYDKHVSLGARMVPFSGWIMPVQYTSIIEEHKHTREKASIFDICHMGEFILKGETAGKDVDNLVTCNIRALIPGKAKYGFFLNERGGIIDDMIAFKISDNEFMIVTNAGTIAKDKEHVKNNLSENTLFEDISTNTAKIDIQGPASQEITADIFGEEIKDIKRFNFIKKETDIGELIISATGYTGEKGYELFVPENVAEAVWDKLIAVSGVKPAGLGARDSLRLEKGYSLYGHDIDEAHSPLEASLEQFVDFSKEFIGKKALLAQKENPPGKILTGFVSASRRSAREGYIVKKDGKDIGIVTSGVFSPCLQKGVGLCYIDKIYAAIGEKVLITNGKAELEAEIKRPPFV